MKKNGLLTFIFACIPGAGQMYYGYMKRGLALLSIFCIGVGLGAIISPLIIVCPIVWMYSFFDTYDLIRHMTQGDPKPDTLLPFENLDSLRRLFPSGNRVIGWVFIGLGAWALYSSIIEPLVINFIGWYAANMVPTLVVAALLIAGGFWLLKGPAAAARTISRPTPAAMIPATAARTTSPTFPVCRTIPSAPARRPSGPGPACIPGRARVPLARKPELRLPMRG